MNECGSASFSKCLICDCLHRCKDGQRVVLNHQCPDRDPDALTNDYIYMRGEFDAFTKITKIEVKRASEGYRLRVAQMRKDMGLCP